eukprot:173314-Heterocapsa_arctica.AAC.1
MDMGFARSLDASVAQALKRSLRGKSLPKSELKTAETSEFHSLRAAAGRLDACSAAARPAVHLALALLQ